MADTTFDDDPVGNLNERLNNIEQERQQRAQAEQMNNFAREVATRVNEFKQEVPDYDQAFEFTMQGRMADLKALGMSEDKAAEIINAEAAFIAESAMRSGKNPGEALYELAKNRGFQGHARRARRDDEGHDDTADIVTRDDVRRTAGDDEFAQALREKGWG